MSPTARHVKRRLSVLVFAAGYFAIRLFWATGGRWGYTACSQRKAHTAFEVATGCSANTVHSLPFVQGWFAVGLCGLMLSVAVVTAATSHRVARIAAWTVCAAMVAVSFPAHLLFEIPAAAFGYPTDWRNIADRAALLGGGLLFGALASALKPKPLRRSTANAGVVQPAPKRMKSWTYAAALIPVVGFTLPHLVWAMGIPLGIPADMLSEARSGANTAGILALSFAPVVGSVLTIGLVCKWGQRFPLWVPVLSGREVPPSMAIVPAAIVALALICYGVIGIVIMTRDIAGSATLWSDVANGWAVDMTEVVFFVWGVALSVATYDYRKLRLH